MHMITPRKRFATPASLVTVALAAGSHSALSAVLFNTPYQVNPPATGSYTQDSTGTASFGAWTSTVTETTTISAGVDTNSTPTSLLLSLVNFSATGPENTLAFTAVVPISAAAGLVSFDYNYVEVTDFGGTANFGYTVNGSPVIITAASGSNSFSFSVNPGDTFGFVLNSSYGSSTSATITNFTAPIPEPSAMALLATGFAGILGMRRSRRQAA
jgi:hypothetical protein